MRLVGNDNINRAQNVYVGSIKYKLNINLNSLKSIEALNVIRSKII